MIAKRYLWLQTILLTLLASLFALAPQPGAAQSNERCFAETGYCISGVIRTYWERNGGLAVFGYPISTVTVTNIEGSWTGPVQWFERDRLEDHSADGQGVLAGRLGARYLELNGIDWQQLPGDNTIQSGCRFFRETQFNLCEPFLGYWQRNGGLERFGYPITRQRAEVIEGREYTVQYFERRRMEIHPELQGSPVLLGLLGRALFTTTEPAAGLPDCLKSAPPNLLPAMLKLQQYAPVGCPAGAAWTSLPASTQSFERGQMIWLSERKTTIPLGYPPTIFTMIEPGPRPDSFSDTWVAGQDPDTPPVTPPVGLYAPWRGFGKLWSERSDIRAAIGWATEPQAQARTVDTQLFENALLIRINETGVVYALGSANGAPIVRIVTP